MKSPSREVTAAPAQCLIKSEHDSLLAQLRRLYPTHESFNAATNACGSIAKLANLLEIDRSLLHKHKKWLDNGAQPLKKRTRQQYKKNSEIDDRIKSFAESELKVTKNDAGFRYTDVKVYALTDEYIPGQVGTEGLVYLRTEKSRTAIPSWGKVANLKSSRRDFKDEL